MRHFMALSYVLAVIGSAQLCAQSLSEHFLNLLQGNGIANETEGISIARDVRLLPSAEVEDALPIILDAAEAESENVKQQVALVLLAISERNDAGEILAPSRDALLSLLRNPDQRICRLSLQLLKEAEGRPVGSQVTNVIAAFVDDQGFDEQCQVAAIGFLLERTSQTDALKDSIGRFSSRTLRPTVRLDLLNSIALSGTTDERLIQVVVDNLSQENPRIKKAAIQTLRRLGTPTLGQGASMLQALAADTSEDAEVRSEASAALREIGATIP